MEGDQQEQLFPQEQLQQLLLLPPASTSSRLTLPWSGLAVLVSLQPLLIPGIYLSIIQSIYSTIYLFQLFDSLSINVYTYIHIFINLFLSF